MDYTFHMDMHQQAIEAEADRLLGVFIRIRMLAQFQRIEFALAGEDAVRKGLVTEVDWLVIKQV